MASTQDSWSNIPSELAEHFLGRLHAHVDRVRFAAVCPHWRSAARQVRLPPPPPLLALKNGDTFYSMPRGEPLHFAGCKKGFTTTCGKWLVYQRINKLLLVDPFSGATMTLPAPSRVYLPGDDCCVSCIRDDYCTCMVEDSEDECDYSDNGENSKGVHGSAEENDYIVNDYAYSDDSELSEVLKSFQVIKLMECSPNLFVALFQGVEFNKIAVCRPGGSKWSVAWGLPLGPTDMAFYEGKLYFVDSYEDLYAMNISVDGKTGDPRVSRIREVISAKQYENDQQTVVMVYLVESCGSLLFVRRTNFHKHVYGEGRIHTFSGQSEPDVVIFEADFGRSQWVKVTTLADDQALFLGPCSRSICMPQGDSPGNRVWFLDDYKDFDFWNQEEDTSNVANHKPFSPLPMISWMGYQGNAGSAWLFPAN